MPKNSMILRVNKKCRICLSDEGSMINIFTVELNSKIKELSECTSIRINDEKNLPKNICHVCLYKLEMWCDFKRQFIYTNKILLKHLKGVDTSDYTESSAKRRHIDIEENSVHNTDEDKKLIKLNNEPPAKTLKLIENDKSIDSPIIFFDNTSKEPLLPFLGLSKNDLATSDKCAGDEYQTKLLPVTRSRLFSGRRTSEQRLASTQRWVARKKALLAATGENDSDTDSMSSDNTQLSPIQKARSKNYHIENEVERLKCLSKSINDSGTIDEEENKDQPIIQSEVNLRNSNEIEKPFESRTIQSELVVGDATFIITSKLILSEPKYSNQSVNIIPEIPMVDVAPIENIQENMDIIDALQLRRVTAQSNDKSFIERCLNIDVEGTDLVALQRIQIELDNYLVNDMKYKLLNNVTSVSQKITKVDNKIPYQSSKNTFQTLEQQLKTIVGKAIQKNIEMNRMRRVPISKIAMSNNRGNKIFSAAFIKAAMKSQIFQPKVVLNRVESIAQSFDSKVNDTIVVDDYSNLMYDDKTVVENQSTNEEHRKINVNSGLGINYLCAKKSKADNCNYSCNICNELFATKVDIEQHLDNHKNSKNTKTSINIISKRKMMRCKCCHEIVESRYVKTHICQWKKSCCLICNIPFKNDHLLMNHLKVHTELMTKDTTVDSHVKKMIEENTITDQVKIKRMENSLQINETSATDNTDAKKITRTNINAITYTCFVCYKNFTDENLLKDHLQKHCDDVSDDDKNTKNAKEQVYQCAICGETLEDKSSLEYHVEKHLFDDNTNTITDDNLVNIQRDKSSIMKFDDGLHDKFDLHTCVQCNEQFDNEINLALHVQGHEEESAIAEWEKHGFIKVPQTCDNHTCTICDDTFDSEEALAHHIDIHNESSHVCILCDKPFLTLPELQNHVNTH